MNGELTGAERERLAEIDSQSPPEPDGMADFRSRLPAPWEVADGRAWADRIRRAMGWPADTADPTGEPDRPQ